MSNNAVPSHGTIIAREHDSSGSPGTFTDIGELNGDINWPAFMRAMTEVTAHNDVIDSYVPGVFRREPMTFSTNFIYDNASHDHSTGLQKAIKDKLYDGYKVTGSDGSSDNHELIGSGYCSNFAKTSPVREGAITAEVTVQFSGAMELDGAAFTPL